MNVKKLFVVLFSFILMLGLVTGCGERQDGVHRDDRLVGVWVWDINADYSYIFNNDGTGERGGAGLHPLQEFVWSVTEENYLTLNFGEEFIDDVWEYSINDYVLSLTNRSDGRFFEYFKVDQNLALTGTWSLESDTQHIFTFNDDGTGERTYAPEFDSFSWFTSENLLIINSDPHGRVLDEHWTFSIDEDVLTLDSRQVPGMILVLHAF
jgi:hypothetical protein